MASLNPLEFVCLSCWIVTDDECADETKTAANRAICPRRRIAKANLPAKQMADLQKAAGRYKPEYQLKHLVRMVEQQAEWNQIPVGGL